MIWGWYYEEISLQADCPFYCPQNNTGFYTIDFNSNPSFTTVNYCPQNTNGFYTFNQAP